MDTSEVFLMEDICIFLLSIMEVSTMVKFYATIQHQTLNRQTHGVRLMQVQTV